MKKKLVHIGNGRYIIRYEESMGSALWGTLFLWMSVLGFTAVMAAALGAL